MQTLSPFHDCEKDNKQDIDMQSWEMGLQTDHILGFLSFLKTVKDSF